MTPMVKDSQTGQRGASEAFSRPPTSLLRRVPRQERGRERVGKILDAAAAAIAEVGVDTMTTNSIAARANTSVGSLYQFFPNKEAIVEALAARYNAELRRINEDAMSSEATFLPLAELIEQIVTPLLQFHEVNPAYRHVYHAMNGPDGPSCGEAELHKTVVSRLETVLEVRAPTIPTEQRHIHATVAVLTVHALLGFAMTASPTMREGIAREVKRLMVSYMEDAISRRISCRPLATTVDNGFAEA